MSAACRDLNKLHPFVKKVAEAFIAECKKQDLNIGISETYRTVERQDYLYMLGRSLPGAKVTNSIGRLKQSYHQWGLAFDIYNDAPGNLYNKEVLKKAITIAKKMGLESGDAWGDSPHLQYTFGLSIRDLRAGIKPPISVTSNNKEDTDLIKAVRDLHLKDVIGNPVVWSSLDKINLKNVPALLKKMGGIDRLLKDKIVSDRLLWINDTYTADHVRSLIIKYSKTG